MLIVFFLYFPHTLLSDARQITLSAIPGQQGSTLLLKNEQGQFQLLRIGPAPTGAQITPANITATTGTNQTIRLQTVPAVSRFTGPPLALRKTIVTTQQVKQKQNVITKLFHRWLACFRIYSTFTICWFSMS